MDDRKKNLELDKICRVCLVQKKDMRPIFGEMIADMLMECASVKIENTDGWPDKICVQCVHSVSRCHAFKTLVEKSDKELRNYIKSLTIVIQEPVLEMEHHQSPPTHMTTRHQHHAKEIVEQTTMHQPQSRQIQTATLPQQIVLSNGQVINTAQIVTTTHGGQQIAQIVNANQLGQLLQSGSTVQMIQPNGQPGQVVQIQRTLDDGCEIIVQPDLSDETQYFEDVTITEHDDIETTEDIIQIQDDDDIEEMFEEDDTEECITIPEELTYSMEGVSEEEDEPDDKEFLADFINAQVSTPAPGRYVCNLCRKEFKQYKWMENHMESHSNWIKANCKKQPQCEICHRSFKGPGMLRMHMKTHETSEKIPTCTICNKQFKSKTILYRHRQIHQMKTYGCGNCTKAFSSPFTLNSHMNKKHSNEQQKFKCAECLIIFNVLEGLKDHVQITGHSVKNNRNDEESS